MTKLPTLTALVILAFAGQASAENAGAIVKASQDRWMKCLKSSFGIDRRETADLNLAAERAFAACATEEEELWQISVAYGISRDVFAHLKAATKQVLIEGK